jgi:hypothetical protein
VLGVEVGLGGFERGEGTLERGEGGLDVCGHRFLAFLGLWFVRTVQIDTLQTYA